MSWYFQKIEAHKAVRAIRGVRHIENRVVVKPETSIKDLLIC